MLVIWTSQVHACVENIPPSPTQWWVNCRQCRPSRRSWLGCIQQQQVYFIIFDASIMKFWKEKKKEKHIFILISFLHLYVPSFHISIGASPSGATAGTSASGQEGSTYKEEVDAFIRTDAEWANPKAKNDSRGGCNATQRSLFHPPSSHPAPYQHAFCCLCIWSLFLGDFFVFFGGGEACLLHV